jgi:hypothetical protein
MGLKGVDTMNLARDKCQCWAHWKTVVSFWVLYKAVNFLSDLLAFQGRLWSMEEVIKLIILYALFGILRSDLISGCGRTD